MHPHYAHLLRRDFLTSTASGIGALALGTHLEKDGLLANESRPQPLLAPRPGHFPARAKHCIFVFLAGAPSQIDLLDPKPLLVKHHGEPLPDTLGEGARFAFISKKTARLKGSPRTFSQCGESGTEFSDLL
ncbi:MAG: DUF1501 domain-containing protein, partial [Pirellulales bacterium]|nr:DUF1501 domain-containing protein [Pirellulales bacterium]